MFGVGEVLVFRNSRFSCQIRFWIDFLMILGGFGSHFGSQNGAKPDSKIDQKFEGFLERSWNGSLAPKEGFDQFWVVCPGSTGKGREGVNPSPRD